MTSEEDRTAIDDLVLGLTLFVEGRTTYKQLFGVMNEAAKRDAVPHFPRKFYEDYHHLMEECGRIAFAGLPVKDRRREKVANDHLNRAGEILDALLQ